MIFVYEKGSNKYLGMAGRIYDNGDWREATLEELYPNDDHSKMGAIVVKDSPKYALDPNAWQFSVNDKGEVTGIERKPQPPKISLSTNAKDTDGDGLPELKADGISKATIDIAIRNPTTKADLYKKPVALRINTTGGRLSERRLTTKTGTASVELTATTDTVTITVSVEADDMETQQIVFELMP